MHKCTFSRVCQSVYSFHQPLQVGYSIAFHALWWNIYCSFCWVVTFFQNTELLQVVGFQSLQGFEVTLMFVTSSGKQFLVALHLQAFKPRAHIKLYMYIRLFNHFIAQHTNFKCLTGMPFCITKAGSDFASLSKRSLSPRSVIPIASKSYHITSRKKHKIT